MIPLNSISSEYGKNGNEQVRSQVCLAKPALRSINAIGGLWRRQPLTLTAGDHAMQHMTFSEVKRAHGLLRFFCPIQSWDQVKTMALIYAIALPSIAILVWLNDPGALWGTLGGSVLGSTWGLYIQLPATLELQTRTEAHHCVGEVMGMLRRLNYTAGERQGCCVHFVPHKPAWMHKFPDYLCWKELEIDLCARGYTITLHGPRSALNVIKRRAERAAIHSAFRF